MRKKFKFGKSLAPKFENMTLSGVIDSAIDKFITDNAFDIIYKQSEYFDLDMLHFNYISKRNLFKFSVKDKLKIIFNRIKSNNIKL